MPPGGVYVGGGEYPEGEWGWSNEFRFKWTSGPLEGLQIKFNHVGGTHGGNENGARLGRFPVRVNDKGSIQIGYVGGIGGEGRSWKFRNLRL